MTFFFIGWILIRLLVLAIIVLGIYKLVTYLRERNGKVRENRGVTVLKERFASGEIDEAEYKERLKVLKS
jgi:uncharacterized membrane protein